MLSLATHGDGLPDLAQTLITFASERGYDIGETKERTNMPGIMAAKGQQEVPVSSSSSSSPQTDPSQISSSLMEPSLAEHQQPPTNNAIALEDRVIQLAIMGRPNVGKSSLLNAFIGESRVIVGPTPGNRIIILYHAYFSSYLACISTILCSPNKPFLTYFPYLFFFSVNLLTGLTRDSIGVEWTFQDRMFRLVDTAGRKIYILALVVTVAIAVALNVIFICFMHNID